MMHCEEARDLFSELLDGDIDAAGRQALEAHLGSCAACAGEWEAFRKAVGAVRGLPRHRAPEGFAAGVSARMQRGQLLDVPSAAPGWKRWTRPGNLAKVLAAAAVLMVAVHFGTDRTRPAPAAAPALALKKAPEEAAGYVPVPAAAPLPPPPAADQAPEPAPVLVAWVLPSSDFALDAGRVQEAVSPRSQAGKAEAEADRANQEKPLRRGPGGNKVLALDAGDKEAESLLREESAKEEKREAPPRVLTFRVRAGELEEVAKRLEALGARPKAAERENLASGGGHGEEKAKAETMLKDAEQPAPEAGISFAGKGGGAEEAWVTLTVVLEPLPEKK